MLGREVVLVWGLGLKYGSCFRFSIGQQSRHSLRTQLHLRDVLASVGLGCRATWTIEHADGGCATADSRGVFKARFRRQDTAVLPGAATTAC